MGFSQSFVAVRGKSPDEVLKVLGVERTGAREEFAESSLNGAELPDGWYLVVSQKDALGLMKDSTLRRLSADVEVIACEVWESLMCSGATGWRNGQQLWSVTHNAQDSGDHLKVDGELPALFSGIRERWLSEQQKHGGQKAKVDFVFEIPVELAFALTGYRHDRDLIGLGDEPFEVLATRDTSSSSMSNKANGQSWLRWLRGRVSPWAK